MQRTATHCNTLQHTKIQKQSESARFSSVILYCTIQNTATHCNTLQHTATHKYSKAGRVCSLLFSHFVLYNTKHCNKLQHTAKHKYCNTQKFKSRASLLLRSSVRCVAVCYRCCNTLQHTTAHQHTATNCNTLQYKMTIELTCEKKIKNLPVIRRSRFGILQNCGFLHA